MSRRINLVGVCAISGLCILLLFASHRFSAPNYATEYYKPRDLRHNNAYRTSGRNHRFGLFNPSTYATTQNSSYTIDDVLNYQRDRIFEEMLLFEYPFGRFGNQADKLTDLTPETGGTPVRSVIITTWRSGSTFLGDILNAMPGNYYHYEPLLNFDIIQIRGPPYDDPAIRNLKRLLKCNYTDLGDYLEYGESHSYLFKHNTRLWRQCKSFPQFCWDPKFLEPFCKLFPHQSMKVVRLRMAIAAQLLYDESLNVRIVLLVRDPRGTLQSRKHREWCPGRPDCDNPASVCRDMVSDFYAAELLLKKFPKVFKVVRYEDLSLNPFDMTKELLDFYGLPFDVQVKDFLDSHTKMDYGGVSSTFRDSKSAPFHWVKDLTFDEINRIQESCAKAMQLWGYKNVDHESVGNATFDPLLPYHFT